MLTTILAVLVAAGGQREEFRAEPDQVLVTYVAKAGATEVSGVSRMLEWNLVFAGEEEARVQLRIPVASFDSGHREVDSRLRAAVETDAHPLLEVEGVVRGRKFEGTVTLHGHSRPLKAELIMTRSQSTVVALTSFSLPLDQFEVRVPGLQNEMAVEIAARLRVHPNALVSFGAVNASN
jgi:hypothetical protein